MDALTPADIALLLAALIGAGVLAGLVAGLFGVGGGTVIVPVLFHLFEVLGVGGESNLHVAVGTSLLIIVAVSWRSLTEHRRHGAVDEAVLKAWSPWVAVGAAAGAAAAGFLAMGALGLIYGISLALVAIQMMLTPADAAPWRRLPVGWMRRGLGAGIGGLSALMGIGGGTFGGLMMTLCGRPIHQAVATASGLGMAIGAPAALGFVVFGWEAAGRPPGSLGYVNLPAALVMGVITTLAAPWGARLAHRLDRRVLKKAFAAYLALTALSVVVKAL